MCVRRFEHKRLGEHTEEEGEKMGAGTRFTVIMLVSKRYKGVEGSTRPHKASHEKEVWPKQGCVNQSSQSMASPAGHEVTAEEPAGQ